MGPESPGPWLLIAWHGMTLPLAPGAPGPCLQHGVEVPIDDAFRASLMAAYER